VGRSLIRHMLRVRQMMGFEAGHDGSIFQVQPEISPNRIPTAQGGAGWSQSSGLVSNRFLACCLMWAPGQPSPSPGQPSPSSAVQSAERGGGVRRCVRERECSAHLDELPRLAQSL